MKSTDKFVLVLVASLFLLIAGCGGGGGSSSPTSMAPTVHMITLPEKPTVPAGSDYMVPEVSIAEAVTIEPGEMETIGYVTFSCPSGGEACVVAQTDDGITSTGGEATVAVSSMVTEDIEEEERLADLRMQENTVDLSGLPEGYDDPGEAGTFTVEPGESETRGDTTYSCPDTAEVACVITVDEDGMATSMGGMATAMISDEADQRKMDAEAVAATKAAATKTTAIKAEADQVVDGGLGGGGGPTGTTPPTPYGMTIERSHDATTVKITDSTMAGDDDPKFVMQDMDLGEGTTMHVRDNGEGVEEVVMVSTDIEAPKATAFAMVTGQALDHDLDTTEDADGDGTPDNDFTALAVDETSADVRKLVMSSEFTPGAGSQTVLTFGGDDPADEDDAAAEVEGTYNGAMGTYMCAGGAADCTVTLDAMGMITAMSDGWIFTPDAGATSDVPDGDYLSYGFWLKKTTEDGAVTYNEVETFAMSSVAASGSVADVTGKATYSGDALGVYVHQVHNPAGNIDSATSGHFTADVSLTAYFGQVPVSDTDTTGTIAPNLLNKLSGTINNFMLSGHDTGPGWSVSLEESAIDTTTGTVTGTEMAKGGGAEGDYSATFHGSTDDGSGALTVQPTSVVGEFNAFFSNGSVAGGFGATKDD